ncbi:MAG: hypothetical protein NT023_07420, partial [Armatimonadetes bacterium]|nr:hypothetical protein [Armatimonadota bacterium]
MQQNFLFRNCSALALSITIALSLSTSLYAKPSSKPAFRKDDASDLKDATTARMVLEKSKTFLDTVPFYLPKAADLPASGRLQTKAKRLYDLLKSISEQKPTATPDGIATQITALESAVNKLKDTPEANKKEKVNSGELLKTAKSANETYTKLVTSLTEYGKGIVSELQNRITAEKLPVDTDTGEVKTSKLAQNLADWIDAALAGEILVSNSLTPDWLQIQKNEAAAFQTSFKTNVLDKLAGWLDAPTEVANSVATSVEAFIATKTYAKASLQIFEGYLATIKQVENVIDAWFFAPSSFKKSSATPTREIEVKLDALRLARVKARGQIAIFSEIITGERSQWKTVQARLYYYDKPQQLVKILNDNAQMLEPNAPNLKQQSDAAYNALFNMESEVYVKRHQIELKNQERLELEERLRKVKTVATAAQTQLADGKKLQSLYNEYKALPDTPVAAKESAKQKFEKERNKYTQKYGVYLDSQNIDAHVSALEEANAKAQGELNGLQDSASGLPTQIKALNEDIVRLQGDILVQTRRIALDARREAQLFGEMRDGSGNVLYTSPVPGTTDPGKKVALYASEGSRTITIRGKEEDIAQVREIIAEFDRPAPQARISIWKIQINGSNNNSLNKAIYETDKKLLQIRQSINRAQDILRNAVTSEVSRTAAAAKQTMKLFRLKESTSPTSQSDDRLARYFYYPKEIRRKLGFVLARNPKTEEELEKAFVKFDVASKLRRALTLLDSKSVALANIYFQSAWEQMRYLNDKSLLYDRMKDLNAAIHNEKSLLAPGGERSEELNQFLASQEKTIGCLKTQLECWISNIKPDSCDVLPIDINDAAYVTSWTLPEPTRVTTLGEALFSLSLGRRTSRSLIIHEFMAQLDSAFTLPARSEGGSYVAQLNAMRDSVLAAYRRGVNVIENHTLQFPKMIFGG